MIDGLQFVLADLLLPAAMSLAGRRQSLGLQVTLLTLKLLPLLCRDSHFFSLGGTARVYALSDRRPCVENSVTYHQSKDHADEELHRVGHGDQHGKISRGDVDSEEENNSGSSADSTHPNQDSPLLKFSPDAEHSL